MTNKMFPGNVPPLTSLCALVTAILLALPTARAADFTVTAPEAQLYYNFNGDRAQDPIITLVRGRTYTFLIDAASVHPFYIVPSDGVENNNVFQGIVTFHVPTNAINNSIQYFCYFHGFGNVFQFVDAPAPAPPEVKILSLTTGTNLVLTSTGTNTWTTIPEYSTNLLATNWYALTVQTNRFINGTNETICGVPPGNNLFLRIRSVPQNP